MFKTECNSAELARRNWQRHGNQIIDMIKKILITGSNGFIGKHLTDFLSKNYSVIGIDKNSENSIDIQNKIDVEKVFEYFKPDIVIHLAAIAGVRISKKFPNEYIKTNLIGSNNIFELCKEYGVEHVIFMSSSSVYDDLGNLKPLSMYGLTKLFGEQLLESFDIKYKTIIRPFTVFGENGRKDQLIEGWIDKIKCGKPIVFYGDGESFRNYVYVGDLCSAIKSIIEKNYSGTLEIGGKDIVKLKDVLNNFQTVFKYIDVIKVDRMVEDSAGRLPNNSNWNEIDYSPKTDFHEKLSEILKGSI